MMILVIFHIFLKLYMNALLEIGVIPILLKKRILPRREKLIDLVSLVQELPWLDM
jgi:hypothetical protein